MVFIFINVGSGIDDAVLVAYFYLPLLAQVAVDLSDQPRFSGRSGNLPSSLNVFPSSR